MAEMEKRRRDMAPGAQTDNPMELFDHLFNNFMGRGMSPFWGNAWGTPALSEMLAGQRAPRVDVSDRAEDIQVRAELPGVSKDDLDVTVDANSVTIRGQTRYEDEQEGETYYRREIGAGQFERTVALPSEVDSENAKASFHDGILELTLPKIGSQKRRRIEIEG